MGETENDRDAAPTVFPEPIIQTTQEEAPSYQTAWLLLYSLIIALSIFLLMIVIVKLISVWNTRKNFKKCQFNLLTHPPVVVGFFHPYCNAGGGGERVLWQSIRALQSRYNFIRCIVYTGDRANKESIFSKVKNRFGINLARGAIEFVYLKRRSCVEAEKWPRFTVLGQSIGSIFLGLLNFVPDVYIDTMGYAFTLQY